jgi:hypothetical protein
MIKGLVISFSFQIQDSETIGFLIVQAMTINYSNTLERYSNKEEEGSLRLMYVLHFL